MRVPHFIPPWSAIGVATALLVGCATPVVADLEEREANEALLALDASGVAATKEPDPEREARFRVLVPRQDTPAAVAVLQARGLPQSRSPGVLEALGDSSLVPSRASEHARWIAGTSGELERSLAELDGVVSARVHLAVAPRDGLSLDAKPLAARASVLLRHRGATAPVGALDVQRLVAGAVPGLDAEQVSVIATPITERPVEVGANLAHFGPLAVTRNSLVALRWIVGGAALVHLLLLTALLVGWFKLRQTRFALEAARAPGAPEAER